MLAADERRQRHQASKSSDTEDDEQLTRTGTTELPSSTPSDSPSTTDVECEDNRRGEDAIGHEEKEGTVPQIGSTIWAWHVKSADSFKAVLKSESLMLPERRSRQLAKQMVSLHFDDGDRVPAFDINELVRVTPQEMAKRKRSVPRGWGLCYTSYDGTEQDGMDNSKITWCYDEPAEEPPDDGPVLDIPPADVTSLDCSKDLGMIEFFAGTGRTAMMAKKNHGMRSVVHDQDLAHMRSDRHLCHAHFQSDYEWEMDVLNITEEWLEQALQGLSIGYTHFSLPCDTFTPLVSKHGRTENNFGLGVTAEAGHGNRIVEHTILNILVWLLKRFPNMLFTIENPENLKGGTPGTTYQGGIAGLNIVKDILEKPREHGGLGAERLRVCYCQFEAGQKKPTWIWTNSPELIRTLGGDRYMCNKQHHCACAPS